MCMSMGKGNVICAEKMVNMEFNGMGVDLTINNKEMSVMVYAC